MTKLLIFFIAFFSSFSFCQREDKKAVEYGIGLLTLKNENAKVRIYSTPDNNSTLVAYAESSQTLLIEKNYKVGKQMIAYGYDESGFAIVGFNKDSSWINVSIDPGNTWDLSTNTGWLKYDRDNMGFVWWEKLLPKYPLFFIDTTLIHFYSSPDTTHEIKIELERDSWEDFDYIMYPIKLQSNFMFVEVETPSSYCRDERDVTPQPRRKKVWIRFLNDQSRPLVTFYGKGC